MKHKCSFLAARKVGARSQAFTDPAGMKKSFDVMYFHERRRLFMNG
jgi:hypothetical protein